MRKYLLPILVLSTTSLVIGCYRENDISDLPPGKYESSTSSTNAYGTETNRTKSIEVERDSSGNKRAVVESETTRDPEGLFNKSTTSSSKKVIEERD